MKKIVFLLFLMLHISFANTPVVWSKTGHRVIGDVAQAHLTRKAKKAISELLDGKDLAAISNFSDEIKADTLYRKLNAWHYVNIPKGKKYDAVEPSKYGDLVVGINTFTTIIKNEDSSKEEKAFSLKNGSAFDWRFAPADACGPVRRQRR